MRWFVVCLCLCVLSGGTVWGQDQPSVMLRLVFSFGSEGDEPGQFSGPQGISLDPDGNLYVADTGNNRLQKFDKRGRFLKQVGGFGWEKEQFHRPVDVCAKTGLDVFVADYNNERIERYDKDLNYISSYYSDDSQTEDLQFGFPLGITISNHGELFLVDDENYRILKINSFGEPELSFGDFRWGDGKLDRPSRIEVTAKDVVYVSDSAADRIVIYDYFGNYNGELGAGLLDSPNGLTSDDKGRVWVADSGNHRVVLFAPGGRVLATWGSEGDKLGAFDSPADVAVGDGWVYVLDTGNSRVQIFEIAGR